MNIESFSGLLNIVRTIDVTFIEVHWCSFVLYYAYRCYNGYALKFKLGIYIVRRMMFSLQIDKLACRRTIDFCCKALFKKLSRQKYYRNNIQLPRTAEGNILSSQWYSVSSLRPGTCGHVKTKRDEGNKSLKIVSVIVMVSTKHAACVITIL